MSNATATTATDRPGGNGESAALDEPLGDVIPGLGEEGERRELRSWFTKLVIAYLKRHYAKHPDPTDAKCDAVTQSVRARAIIRAACIKSSLTGAAAATLTTGATLVTAQTEGFAGLIAIPAAALAIGGEMLYRSLIHLEMTCDIADVFGMHFNADEPSDLFRLYALAFGTSKHKDEDEPGKELVSEVTHIDTKEVGEEIGHKLLGESVLRNVVPVIGIATSAYSNWKITDRVGNTVRRYLRYQRALHDALDGDEAVCRPHLDLLIEGLWFIFSADGQLSQEETAILGHYLRKVSHETRAVLGQRFIEDEKDWIERLIALPEPARDAFLHALEVSAAVDKSVSLPEQKILSRAAHALGRKFDMRRVAAMMREFEEVGVLAVAR